MHQPRPARLLFLQGARRLAPFVLLVALASCQIAPVEPPHDAGLTPGTHGGEWVHLASGFAFPEKVADLARESGEPSDGKDSVEVRYRSTTARTERINLFINESVTVFPAAGMTLQQALAARTAILSHVQFRNPKLAGSGAAPPPQPGGSEPGLFARYTTDSENYAGFNTDGETQIALYKCGNFFVDFTCSFSSNLHDDGTQEQAAFIKAFPWPHS